MKIVFLAYLHGYGGAERQIVMLANAMAEKGHDVVLASICVNNCRYELNSKMRYVFLPDREHGIKRIFSRYQDIMSLLAREKPDVTVNFWFQSAYMTAIMKKSITGKVIYSERGDPGDKEYTGVLGMIRKLTIPRIDGFVFQSKGAQYYFNNSVRKRSVVISNPVFINRDDYPKVVNRRKVIITVGRLHPQKNHKLLIDAFAKCAEEFPEYTVEIYGDGPLKEETQKYIVQKKLDDRIFLKGTSDNIYQYMVDCSLFVLTSDYEGLPNTLLEAMALGVPCISTDCKPGGAREIIHNGRDGIIVSCDDKDELVNAIRFMLINHEVANDMGTLAAINIKRYSPILIYKHWEKFFYRISGVR